MARMMEANESDSSDEEQGGGEDLLSTFGEGAGKGKRPLSAADRDAPGDLLDSLRAAEAVDAAKTADGGKK